MKPKEDVRRFERLTYDNFRRLATDESLSRNEKVGFPEAYRAGKERAIVEDVIAKLEPLGERDKIVVDIGPGCSDVPRLLVDHCGRQGHSLVLVDSPEMLAQLSDEPFVRKIPGRFPVEVQLQEYVGRADAVLVYSVLHYVFVEGNLFAFLDRALQLLAPGGALLLGDVPNVSKRRRFFASDAGRAFHRAYTGRNEPPSVEFNRLEHEKIDDAVLLSIVARARAAGFDAYVLPQRSELPMANRREDILLTRP